MLTTFSRLTVGFTLFLAITMGRLLNEPLLSTQPLINLVFLLLMAPVAGFFSTQYWRLITTKKQINVLLNQAK